MDYLSEASADKEQTAQILMLPPEVLELIISYLTFETVSNIRLVSDVSGVLLAYESYYNYDHNIWESLYTYTCTKDTCNLRPITPMETRLFRLL